MRCLGLPPYAIICPMKDLTLIVDLKDHIGRPVCVGGWVYHLRSSGKLRFLVLRDGTGYVHQLAGEQIPLEARIVAVADVFDALEAVLKVFLTIRSEFFRWER